MVANCKPQRPSLIRIDIEKPMGIVFEPVPQNESVRKHHGPKRNLDLGARIKDMTKGGAAELTGKLMIGDQLLSIEDEFTTNLPFDDIMDYIVRGKKSISMLFKKTSEEPKSHHPPKCIESLEPEIARSDSGMGKSKIMKRRENHYDEKAAELIRRAVNEKKERRSEERDERGGAGDDVDRNFVEIFFDTLCNPCGKHTFHPNTQMSKEDGFIYLPDKSTAFVQ